jgi:hypothetical protein
MHGPLNVKFLYSQYYGKTKQTYRMSAYGQVTWGVQRVASEPLRAPGCYIKVNQSHYRPEVPRGFREVKFPRIRDDGPGWW